MTNLNRNSLPVFFFFSLDFFTVVSLASFLSCSRPSEDRTIPLTIIADQTKLSVEDVEHLLIKSLSVSLLYSILSFELKEVLYFCCCDCPSPILRIFFLFCMKFEHFFGSSMVRLVFLFTFQNLQTLYYNAVMVILCGENRSLK